MLVLLAAMRQEVDGMRKRLGLAHAIDRGGWRTFEGGYEGKELALIETGPGRHRAEAAALFMMMRYPVTSVISFGFAGGLTDEVKVGDVVLCRRLHDGAVHGPRSPYQSDEGLITLAVQVPLGDAVRAVLGSSVTVDGVVIEPRQKRALREASGADAVDMEGYWVADVAADAGVPFLAVRAISDPVTQRLPPFDRWISTQGRWQMRRAAAHLLAHPLELAALPALYRNAQRAEEGLVQLIAGIIPRL